MPLDVARIDALAGSVAGLSLRLGRAESRKDAVSFGRKYTNSEKLPDPVYKVTGRVDEYFVRKARKLAKDESAVEFTIEQTKKKSAWLRLGFRDGRTTTLLIH